MRRPRAHLALIAAALATPFVAAAIALAAAHLATASPRTAVFLATASPRTASQPTNTPQPQPPPPPQTLTIGRPASVHPIRSGFLGLSLEYTAIEPYAGTDPKAINPVLLQLIRNLTLGQRPVIRIGGETTDWSWWPVPGMRKPAGVKYTLTPELLAVTRALAQQLDARLILGVDLEADSRAVAGAEARALTERIGEKQIEALELGNEPEDYGIFTWDGSGAKGRPPGYDVADFVRDFSQIGGALPGPLAGPAMGAPKWYADLESFLAAEPRVRLVTLHRYPVQQCYVQPWEPNYPTIPHILWNRASRGLADSIAPEVATAHARGLRLRVDEMNTVSCGYEPQVGFSFASALWAVNALFAMASVGVDGVNIHTYPNSTDALFAFTHANGTWRALVEPEYYGLLMFAQAAPPGSRLLRLSGAGAGAIDAWATRAPKGQVRVALINDNASAARTITVQAPATTAAPAAAATLERLEGPGLAANKGVTLGGQGFGSGTATGQLFPRTSSVSPRTSPRSPGQGDYTVVVPAASAALLTLPQ